MRNLQKGAPWLMILTVLGCAPPETTAVVDMAAEEQAIRAADRQLLAAAQAGDATAFAARFAPDGQLLFPNQPAVAGREAIRANAERDFAAPGFSVTWEPSRHIVSEGGDLAASIGTYQLSVMTPGGPYEDHGKYMTLWQKVDGQWLVAADMINTDVPLATPDGNI